MSRQTKLQNLANKFSICLLNFKTKLSPAKIDMLTDIEKLQTKFDDMKRRNPTGKFDHIVFQILRSVVNDEQLIKKLQYSINRVDDNQTARDNAYLYYIIHRNTQVLDEEKDDAGMLDRYFPLLPRHVEWLKIMWSGAFVIVKVLIHENTRTLCKDWDEKGNPRVDILFALVLLLMMSQNTFPKNFLKYVSNFYHNSYYLGEPDPEKQQPRLVFSQSMDSLSNDTERQMRILSQKYIDDSGEEKYLDFCIFKKINNMEPTQDEKRDFNQRQEDYNPIKFVQTFVNTFYNNGTMGSFRFAMYNENLDKRQVTSREYLKERNSTDPMIETVDDVFPMANENIYGAISQAKKDKKKPPPSMKEDIKFHTHQIYSKTTEEVIKTNIRILKSRLKQLCKVFRNETSEYVGEFDDNILQNTKATCIYSQKDRDKLTQGNFTPLRPTVSLRPAQSSENYVMRPVENVVMTSARPVISIKTQYERMLNVELKKLIETHRRKDFTNTYNNEPDLELAIQTETPCIIVNQVKGLIHQKFVYCCITENDCDVCIIGQQEKEMRKRLKNERKAQIASTNSLDLSKTLDLNPNLSPSHSLIFILLKDSFLNRGRQSSTALITTSYSNSDPITNALEDLSDTKTLQDTINKHLDTNSGVDITDQNLELPMVFFVDYVAIRIRMSLKKKTELKKELQPLRYFVNELIKNKNDTQKNMQEYVERRNLYFFKEEFTYFSHNDLNSDFPIEYYVNFVKYDDGSFKIVDLKNKASEYTTLKPMYIHLKEDNLIDSIIDSTNDEIKKLLVNITKLKKLDRAETISRQKNSKVMRLNTTKGQVILTVYGVIGDNKCDTNTYFTVVKQNDQTKTESSYRNIIYKYDHVTIT